MDHLDLSSKLDEVSASEAQQEDLKCPHFVEECLPEAQSGLVSEKEDAQDVFFKGNSMLQERELREIGDKINIEVCLVGGLEGPNGKDSIKVQGGCSRKESSSYRWVHCQRFIRGIFGYC